VSVSIARRLRLIVLLGTLLGSIPCYAYDVYRDIKRQVEKDREAGRYEDAIRKLEIALAGMSEDHEYWASLTLQLADLYQTTGQWEKARDEWVDLAARHARDFRRGRRSALTEALYLDYVSEAAICSHLTWAGTGMAHFSIDLLDGKPESASEYLKSLAETKGENRRGDDRTYREWLKYEIVDAFVVRAALRKRLGRLDEAKRDVSSALELEENSEVLQARYLQLARELAAKRRYYLADFYYAAALLLPGDVPKAQINKEALANAKRRDTGIDVPKD